MPKSSKSFASEIIFNFVAEGCSLPSNELFIVSMMSKSSPCNFFLFLGVAFALFDGSFFRHGVCMDERGVLAEDFDDELGVKGDAYLFMLTSFTCTTWEGESGKEAVGQESRRGRSISWNTLGKSQNSTAGMGGSGLG